MTTETCCRCRQPIPGVPLMAFPPRPRGPMETWRPVPGLSLCLECGGNGRNVLTAAEVATLTAPAGQAVLPYPEADGTATAGHSGSETSRERARDEARTGTVKARQNAALRLLASRGATGITVAEYREVTGLHHGQASSVLSVLHKEGRIARLAERRARCEVYVLPEHVDGRATRAHKANADAARCPHPAAVCESTETMLTETTERLRSANARLAEIHRVLASHSYDGQPTNRIIAIRRAIEAK